MADVSSNSLKRPHPEDDLHNPQKKSRSNTGSPAPGTNGTARPDVSKMMAEARARAAAVAARLQGSRAAPPAGPSQSPPLGISPSPSPGLPPASVSGGAMSKLDQLRARVAAATGKTNAASMQQRTASPAHTYPTPDMDEGPSRARGGLDVGLHPALLGDSGQDGRAWQARGMQPKFATTMANRRSTESPAPSGQRHGKGKKQLDLSGPSAEELKSNPYYDASLGPQGNSRSRGSRQLVFNQKGKYIQQANALRRQAALEEMKKRIAESSRRAGIDEDLDTEKAFLVQAPPEIEWWDEGLVATPNYDHISDDPANLKIDSSDSIITIYIQHPVLLDPPQDKNMPAPKPMYLTPKEQAKLRRQRRQADLKEQQAKIRLGLEPAPPPKVKKSNLMRVLGEEAVKDPTAVEARVNREIAERAHKHEETNEERKLTKEERAEKVAAQQEKDAQRGIRCSVYKIDTLSNGRHRFKIAKNAEQNALTGVCILHPKFCLVVVEGGEHSIAAYKKLMLNRIDWTETATPNAVVREGNKEALASWLQAEDERGEPKDLSLNKCTLVWEGELKARAFRKWGSRVCETDSAARDALSRAKMDNFWTQAKSMK
ncbi:MAG: hypothetical protein M1819_005363 [Sarea resinae]|nr:MAG: hypothetical protein M1819_005363 [Sarea resinae]